MAGLLRHALQEEQDRSSFEAWVTWYPHMDNDKRETFEQFKKRVSTPQIKASNKSLDEIEAEMDAIIKAYESEARK